MNITEVASPKERISPLFFAPRCHSLLEDMRAATVLTWQQLNDMLPFIRPWCLLMDLLAGALRLCSFKPLQGRLTVYYVSSYYQVCQRHHPATPLLTARQTAALAEFDTLASSPDLVMDWVLQPGDVQLLNNHVTVHNRSAYVDHPVSPCLPTAHNLVQQQWIQDFRWRLVV